MKKIFILCLVALFVAAGIGYAATPAYRLSPGAGDIVAKHGTMATPDKTFRLVRYMPQIAGPNHPALTADSIVVWDTVSDDGVTVTTTITSYDSTVAGVAVIAILTPELCGNFATGDLANRNWGWIQTYGLCKVDLQADGLVGTAGSALGTGVQPGKASIFLGSTTSATVQGNAGFYFDTAAAAATDVECFINL